MSQFLMFLKRGRSRKYRGVRGVDIAKTTFHLSGFLDFGVLCVATLALWSCCLLAEEKDEDLEVLAVVMPLCHTSPQGRTR